MLDKYEISLDDGFKAFSNISISKTIENCFEISFIYVPINHRRKGLGTKLLQMICDDADKTRVNLSLRIEESLIMSYNDLEAWYQKFDFYLFDKSYNYLRKFK